MLIAVFININNLILLFEGYFYVVEKSGFLSKIIHIISASF